MKFICPNCEKEENFNLWLKNYNEYICTECHKNVLGRARKAVAIYIPTIGIVLFAMASFLNYKMVMMGYNKTVWFVVTMSIFAVSDFIMMPVGIRYMYRKYNKSK